MNNACFALSTLLTSVASMLLVGPAECQVAPAHETFVVHTFQCGTGLFMYSYGSDPGLETSLIDAEIRETVAPCLPPAGVELCQPPARDHDTQLGASAATRIGSSDQVGAGARRRAAVDLPIGSGFAVDEPVFHAEVFHAEVLHSSLRQGPWPAPLLLETGYDTAYDNAMQNDSEPQLFGEELAPLAAENSETTFERLASSVQRLRAVQVVRRCFNGELWRSSSQAIRQERLARAAERADLAQAARSIQRQMAMRAAESLDRVGLVLANAASQIRSWADRPRTASSLPKFTY